jgi:hypothetical protein
MIVSCEMGEREAIVCGLAPAFMVHANPDVPPVTSMPGPLYALPQGSGG